MKLPRLNQERAPARDNIRGQLGGAQDWRIHSGYAAAVYNEETFQKHYRYQNLFSFVVDFSIITTVM